MCSYTDGTPVGAGDRIRFKQAPGGILPPSGDWRYGVAVPYPGAISGPHTVVLEAPDGRQYNLHGHIIERDDSQEATS